ncbi:MAG: hypothetical protein OEN02_04620 [Gammaproteobacteria bacterium]|nr:hypothetical protein [Gammaproteobacteria bacterium]MDH3536235.1 hypothetical protein [Gammaproteobacteria bacterium]
MDNPVEMCRFVEAHRAELDYLLFDAGFDYRMEGNTLVILETGSYWVF